MSLETLEILKNQKLPGEMIAALEKQFPELDRKSFLKLAGSDRKRKALLSAAAYLGKRYCAATEHESEDYQLLAANLSKRDALELFSTLPFWVVPKESYPQCTEEREDLKLLGSHYLTVGWWLLSWHKGNGASHKEMLKGLDLISSEKRAWVSHRRYDCLTYMSIHSTNEFFKDCSVPLVWLLIEISACRTRIRNLHPNAKKRRHYDLMSEFWGQLDYFGEDPEIESLSGRLSHFLEELEGAFYYYGRELAKEDPDFDEFFWGKYIQFERKWGRGKRDYKGVMAFV